MKLIKFSGNIIIVITGTTAPIVKISEKEAKKIKLKIIGYDFFVSFDTDLLRLINILIIFFIIVIKINRFTYIANIFFWSPI
jgi:hypothetical protein